MQWIEALDDRRFGALVLDWIARGNGGGSKGGREVFDVESTSIRCATWMQQVAVRAHRLPADCVDEVVRSVAQQVRRLDAALRRLDVLMRAEALGRVLWRRGGRGAERAAVLLEGARTLCWAGCFFEGQEAARWIRHGERLVARALSRAFLADGVHVRRDPVSHARACVTLLECRAVLGNHAIVHDLEAAIEKGCAALSDRVHPDGCPSLIFGGGLYNGHAAAAILAAAGRVCGVSTVWKPNILLEQAGVCGWRADGSCFLFACGAEDDGAVVEQDSLAFEWTVHGERIFVAGGRDGPALLVGNGGSEAGRARRTRLQVLPDGLVAEGIVEARSPGRRRLRRLLRSTAHQLRIEDRVEGGAADEARALLVCHPLALAERSSDRSVMIRRGAVSVRVESQQPITIEEGVWNADVGVAVRTQRLVVRLGLSPCSGSVQMTAHVAHASRKPVTAKLERMP